MGFGKQGRSDAQKRLSTPIQSQEASFLIALSRLEIVIRTSYSFIFFPQLPIMDHEKLVSICRHELRLGEDSEVARLIREVKIVQCYSNDIFARLTKKHRIKAWEIMSGYMLAWKYVEDLDGLGSGQRFWKGKTSRPDALIWPEDKKKWSMMTCIQLTILIYARILAGVEKLFIELQDYSMIARQKNKSRPTPKIGKEAVGHATMSSVSASDT